MSKTPLTDVVRDNICRRDPVTTWETVGELVRHAEALEAGLAQWRPASTPPEVVVDAYCFKDSDEVLATAGGEVFIAQLRVWSEEMGGKSEWYRGDWCMNGVTHWQPLPQLPGGAK